MIGLAVNLALFAADQTVHSVKMVNGFAVDRAQNIHGFAVDRAQDIHGFAVDRAQELHGFAQHTHGYAVDRAQEILGMLGHAAETAKTCALESVKQVHNFVQGGARAMLEICQRAAKTAKQWMAIVVVLVKLSWGAASRRFYRSAPGGRVLATVPKKTKPRYTRVAKPTAGSKAGAKAGGTGTSKKRTRKHKGKKVMDTGDA